MSFLKLNKFKIALTLILFVGYFLYQYQKDIIFRGCTIQDSPRLFLCDLWDILGMGFYTWSDAHRTLSQTLYVLVILLLSYSVASLVEWVYLKIKK